MVGESSPKDVGQASSGWPTTTRPVIHATQGVISSGHYLTSMAGMRMLLSGGNAFDAVVAATFAAAVVEPIATYSLGAEGVFMLYDAKSQDLLALSGQGVAPGKATVDFYKSQGPRHYTDRSRAAGAPVLHRSRRRPRSGCAARAVRDQDPGRGAGPVHRVRQGRYSELRVHA